MKKFLVILSLVTCLLGLSACGNKDAAKFSKDFPFSEDMVAQNSEYTINMIYESVKGEMVDQLAEQFENQYPGSSVQFIEACESWKSNAGEVGSFEGIVEGSLSGTGDAEEFTVQCEIIGSQRNAEIVLSYTSDNLVMPVVTINPLYTMSEKMEKAALNTLLGMGTVFAVLILISLIIGCFGFINKAQQKSDDKKKANVASDAVDKTIAQIIENEELSNDTELVAVIAAAIAASEGAASTDGFVVRSIRRANTKKWQNA